MTRPRDDRGSAGRENPAGPFSLYRRLMGRPPGYDQIQRLTKIGELLDAGPDDSAWGLVVAQESYLVWMQESALQTKTAIRAWCASILAAILLVALFAGGLAWNARSIDVEAVVAQQVDRTIERLLAKRTECSAIYGQPYCDAVRIVAGNPAKRQIVGATAVLSDDAAAILASNPDLAQALTWITRLNSLQWEQIMKMSAVVQAPNQKVREGR